MPPTSKILFLIIGSNVKTDEGEKPVYSIDGSIRNLLAKQSYERLYEGRHAVYKFIKNGNHFCDGKLLNQLPYNINLQSGPDIDISDKTNAGGKYLPAVHRFFGRFYVELGKDGINQILDSEHHILIVTGLYGLVSPGELIQNHSIDVRDHKEVASIWRYDDLLTDIIVSYIHQYKIEKVFDFMAARHYQNLIAWTQIKEASKNYVLHGFSRQFAGDDLLRPLAHVLKALLLKDVNALNQITPGHIEKTVIDDVILLSTPETNSPDIAREEIKNENELSINDQIGRIRRNYIKIFDSMKYSSFIGFYTRVELLEAEHYINFKIADLLKDFCRVRNEIEYHNKTISEVELKGLINNYYSIKKALGNRFQLPTDLEQI